MHKVSRHTPTLVLCFFFFSAFLNRLLLTDVCKAYWKYIADEKSHVFSLFHLSVKESTMWTFYVQEEFKWTQKSKLPVFNSLPACASTWPKSHAVCVTSKHIIRSFSRLSWVHWHIRVYFSRQGKIVSLSPPPKVKTVHKARVDLALYATNVSGFICKSMLKGAWFIALQKMADYFSKDHRSFHHN